MKYTQIDWRHYLNRQLGSWYLVTPGIYGGLTWRDLCNKSDGALTLLDVVTCWTPSTRQGSLGSIHTDGVDGYVSLPIGGGLNNVQTASISMWVRWDGTQDQGFGTNYGPALGRQVGASFSNHLISLSTNNPDTALIRWAPYVNSTYACTSVSSPGDGRWRHIIVTYSSGAHALYIDGVQESTGATTGSMANDVATPLTIGAWIGAGGGYSHAEYDCVRIFPERIITVEEAFDEYQHTSNYCKALLRRGRRRRLGSTGIRRFNTRLDGLGGVSSLNPSLQGVR